MEYIAVLILVGLTLLYMYRGRTLPGPLYHPNPDKNPHKIPCLIALGALLGFATHGGLLAMGILAVISCLAYLPSPDALGRFGTPWFVTKMNYKGNVEKFDARNMAVRHTASGILLAVGGLYFTPLALLLVPCGAFAAFLGYSQSGKNKLRKAEGIFGLLGLGLPAAIIYLKSTGVM